MSKVLRNWILLGLMALAAAMAWAMRPNINLSDELPKIDLASMIPSAFSDWREDPNQTAQVINPQQKNVIEKIYSETLSRSYVNRQGYRIMLSIAYGRNQSDALALHKPEICYPAQGFSVLDKKPASLVLLGNPIATTRISTNLGRRFEPITYWTIVGNKIVTSGMGKKLVEISYAFKDRVPDGMLFRISSIDNNTEGAYAIHARFADEIVAAIAIEHRNRFIGDTKPH